jgi:hypothetical protein
MAARPGPNSWEQSLMDLLGAVSKGGGAEKVGEVVQALVSGKVPGIHLGGEGVDEASLFALATEKLAQKMREEPGLINWLRVAICTLGSQSEAARRLGVTRQAVSLWLKPGLNGIRNAPYQMVEHLSELSGIPLNLIGKCGKENEAQQRDGKSVKRSVKPAKGKPGRLRNVKRGH